MPSPPFLILIDGQCPICKRQGGAMLRLDKGRNRIAVQDFTDPAFDPARYGVTHEKLMTGIHGVLPDGRIISEMEVLREAYRRLGRGWLLAPTGWPLLKPLYDRFYRWFARNRHRFTTPWSPRCDTDRCSAPPPVPRR